MTENHRVGSSILPSGTIAYIRVARPTQKHNLSRDEVIRDEPRSLLGEAKRIYGIPF